MQNAEMMSRCRKKSQTVYKCLACDGTSRHVHMVINSHNLLHAVPELRYWNLSLSSHHLVKCIQKRKPLVVATASLTGGGEQEKRSEEEEERLEKDKKGEEEEEESDSRKRMRRW